MTLPATPASGRYSGPMMERTMPQHLRQALGTNAWAQRWPVPTLVDFGALLLARAGKLLTNRADTKASTRKPETVDARFAMAKKSTKRRRQARLLIRLK